MAVFAALGAWILSLPEGPRLDFWGALGSPADIGNFIPFADSRAITAGWVCTRKGIDVLVNNPCDPFGRLMQYPKLWMLPSRLGGGIGWTNVLGFANALAVFGTVLFVMGPLRRVRDALVYLVLLLSLPVVLLVQRGNMDGVIFAMVGLGVAAWASRRPAARVVGLALVLLASMLKVYPVVAGWGLLRRGPVWARFAVAGAVAAFCVYLLATWSEISLIAAATQQGTFPAFGLRVLIIAIRHPGYRLPLQVQSLAHNRGDLALMVAGGIAFALTAAWLAWRVRTAAFEPVHGDPAGERRLELFLAGSSIYVVSYLVFINWDYRLIFVLLSMPELLRWSFDTTDVALRRLAGGAVVAVTVTFVMARFSQDAPLLYGVSQGARAALCLLLLSMLLAELKARVEHFRRERSGWPDHRVLVSGPAAP